MSKYVKKKKRLGEDYQLDEVINYFEAHSEKEALEHFNVSKSSFYRFLKKNNYKKPKELVTKRRMATIDSDPTFWSRRNEKSILTNISKYGTEWYTQTSDYVNRAKETNLKRYGCEWSLQSKEIRDKGIETSLEKYGCKNAGGSSESVKKIKETKKLRYGDENYNNSSKIRDTWFSNLSENKHKYRCYVYKDVYFDSFPELAYYMYMLDSGVDIVRCDIKTLKFEYYYNNELHYYIPDFIVNGDIVEIKSDYLLKKMKVKDTRENAKYRCMLENNVIIINNKKFEKYTKWFLKHYSKEEFKVAR